MKSALPSSFRSTNSTVGVPWLNIDLIEIGIHRKEANSECQRVSGFLRSDSDHFSEIARIAGRNSSLKGVTLSEAVFFRAFPTKSLLDFKETL
jgi:hypothetical protein